jgi:aspartate aminotransferase
MTETPARRRLSDRVRSVDRSKIRYVFDKAKAYDDTDLIHLEIAERLLDEYSVVVAPGSGFGEAGEGYIRLSFANGLDALESGLDRIESMVRSEVRR